MPIAETIAEDLFKQWKIKIKNNLNVHVMYRYKNLHNIFFKKHFSNAHRIFQWIMVKKIPVLYRQIALLDIVKKRLEHLLVSRELLSSTGSTVPRVPVQTGMYRYLPVCTGTYRYVPVKIFLLEWAVLTW
jgi:hypothetical protein